MSDLIDSKELQELFRSRESRTPWHAKSMLGAILFPLFVFIYVFWVNISYWRHYHYFWAMVAGPWLCLAISCVFLAMGYVQYSNGDRSRSRIVIATALTFATCYGWHNGDHVYWNLMYPYYEYQDSSAYQNIDPSQDFGQAYMDAGKVYFKEGSFVATTKSKAFQNHGIYCVAPIVRQPIENQDGVNEVDQVGPLAAPASGTFDWWAVGKDCCDPNGGQFTCGEASNPLARSGMRMLDDSQRPFFLMGVQAWSTKFDLPATHPLLFYWVQDPLLQEDTFNLQTNQNFLKYIAMAFLSLWIWATFAHFILWKLGVH